jgi:TIR domain/Caspase domain
MAERSGEGAKPSVFISYSRDDLDFADQLEAGLTLCGFAPTIDRHGISGGEDWKSRLGGLIRDADSVVFVMSPSSAGSDICRWEVAEAARMGKRTLPVICRPLGDTRAPEQLALLNYIYFYPESKSPGSGFGTGLARLDEALKTDIAWLREHTRLLGRAHEWLTAGRAENRLLRGVDIEAARMWAGSRPKNAPEPTDLHLDYIKASEHAESLRANAEQTRFEEMAMAQQARADALAEREAAVRKLSRRTAVGLAGAGGLTALSGGLAYWGTDAEDRFRRERERVARAGDEALQAAIEKAAMRPDIQGLLTIFALEPSDAREVAGGRRGSLMSQSLLRAASDRNIPIEQAVRIARDEILRDSHVEPLRPFITTDLNAEIFLRRHPPERKRYAFVIGNNDYRHAPALRWTAYDADSWATFLREAGFDLSVVINATRSDMLQLFNAALARMSHEAHDSKKNSKPTPLLLVYYAGHGISMAGRNFLLPVDVSIDTQEQLEANGIDVETIYTQARSSGGASIFILNPQTTALKLSR